MNAPPTLGEGHTPLLESVMIGPNLNLRLLFKLELCNPTGSYKDRFVAAQMAEFLRSRVHACVATSSGNTGASLAAFSARYDVQCTILVNEFAPANKVAQMRAYGARVFRVRDFVISPGVTDRVYARLHRISEVKHVRVVVSAYRYCPDGMRGVEAIATELLVQVPAGIDHVFVPVGGGGLYSAVCRGFCRRPPRTPAIHAVQPEGCATVVSAFETGHNEIIPVTTTTRVSGLAVPFDIDASLALSHLRTSGGRGIAVSDEEVFTTQKRMLREEGIWCEPAGATALAGCLRACEQGCIEAGATVVCLVTGHGFKDPESLSLETRETEAPLIQENDVNEALFEVRA